jgi:Na+/H+ antiporter NhaD/arsenite permease-like protein
MFMSAVLSMLIDSITVILFLAAVTVELAQLLKFNPVPVILAEIFCANLGGSATMCGDPPNIIIGTSLGYSFGDFICNTGVMAGISLIFAVLYFYFIYRKQLAGGGSTDASCYPDPSEAIKDKRGFVISCIIFLCAVVMLVTHAQTGLTVAFIGLFIAVVTLITAGKSAPELMKKVDYKTLLFFIGLFVVVGGLEETGILEIIAGFIGKISGGNVKLMIAIIIWGSAVASAFIDNIPFAATMIPVIKSLAATQGVDLSVLAWTLSMGTDIGGSATPIGASANVVGTAVAAKEGYPIGWGQYCKVMAPATIMVVLISMVFIFFRYL